MCPVIRLNLMLVCLGGAGMFAKLGVLEVRAEKAICQQVWWINPSHDSIAGCLNRKTHLLDVHRHYLSLTRSLYGVGLLVFTDRYAVMCVQCTDFYCLKGSHEKTGCPIYNQPSKVCMCIWICGFRLQQVHSCNYIFSGIFLHMCGSLVRRFVSFAHTK